MLDAIDLRILETLQSSARISNLALSKKAGLSPPPCLRRVRILRTEGVIAGYHARVNPQALGLNLEAFIEVTLHHEEGTFDTFEASLDSWPWARGYYMLAGGADYLVHVIAPDYATYHDFVQQEVKPLVAHMRTYVVARSYNKVRLPIGGTARVQKQRKGDRASTNRPRTHV